MIKNKIHSYDSKLSGIKHMNNEIKLNKKENDFVVIYEGMQHHKEIILSINSACKHAKEIKAFKEGKSIQFKFPTSPIWMNISTPTFKEELEYRIKPEVLFINEFNEEFTDKNIKEKVYYFYYSTLLVANRENLTSKVEFNKLLKKNITSNPYKSKVNLYTAIAEYCRTNIKQQKL